MAQEVNFRNMCKTLPVLLTDLDDFRDVITVLRDTAPLVVSPIQWITENRYGNESVYIVDPEGQPLCSFQGQTLYQLRIVLVAARR